MVDKMIAVYMRISVEDRTSTDDKLSVEDGTTRQSKKTESNSISHQRNYILSYLQSHNEFQGMEVQEFVDDGYSGTNFSRPKMQELLELCRLGKVACIIVKDFSRFGRNYVELGDYLEQLFPFLGIRFISLNDYYDSEKKQGDTGGLELGFQNLVYDLYSRDLSKKVYSAVGTKMKQGEYLPGAAPYGYQNDREKKRLVPDEEAANIVRRIFAEVAGGKEASEVAKALNEENVLVPLLYKQKKGEMEVREHSETMYWTRQKIYRIIRNEKYMGTMVYRQHKTLFVGSNVRRQQEEDKWVKIADHHEALVEKEIFEAANEKIRKSGKAKRVVKEQIKWNPFVCGYCGHKLVLHETKTSYYRCRNAKYTEDMCKWGYITKKEMDRILLEEMNAIKKENQKKAEQVEQQKEVQVNKENLEKQIQYSQEKSLCLYEEYRYGQIDKDKYLREKNKYKNKENNKFLEEQKRMDEGKMLQKVCMTMEDVEEIILYANKKVVVKWKSKNDLLN